MINVQTLKRFRVGAGLSQEELAKQAGVGVATIQRLEDKGYCSLRVLYKVSKVLDVDMAVLLIGGGENG